MFAVIFEVNPKPEQWESYLGYARLLRPELEQIDGFIANERFSSRRRDGWLLSLSIWRDEKAVIRWRTLAQHHEVQQKGRLEVFRDYHLRVGEIISDNQLPAGQGLLQQRLDETEAAAKLIVLTEAVLDPPPELEFGAVSSRLGAPKDEAQPGLVDWDVFESISEKCKFILLASWRDAAAAGEWVSPIGSGTIRCRRVRVVRDYGMFDRAEAPQYHPPVGGGRG
jgi:heme-degrading monooxygenase HmoA